LLPLAILVGLVAVFFPHEAGNPIVHLVARAGGLVLLIVGEAIRMHVAGRAKPGTSGRGCNFRSAELIIEGLYSRTRNPLYLGNLLIWAGMAVLTTHVVLLAICLSVVGLHYHFIIRAEERFLLRRHGDRYRRYRTLVPRFFPRLRHCAPVAAELRSPDGAVFSLPRALFREHDTLFAILAGAWGIASLDAGFFRPGNVVSSTGLWWISIPVVSAVAWLVLKVLKKARRPRRPQPRHPSVPAASRRRRSAASTH
jgi:protein-S-isoprenylcysteine O-methyltransferase Ste14